MCGHQALPFDLQSPLLELDWHAMYGRQYIQEAFRQLQQSPRVRTNQARKHKQQFQTDHKDEKEFETNYRNFLVKKLIESEVVTQNDLIKLGENRAQSILEYLANKHQLTDISTTKVSEIQSSEDDEKLKSKLSLLPK